jgi:hypothetical protein
MALEGAELTPALLSREARPRARSSSASIHVGAWRDRGVVTVLATNTENRPQAMRLEVEGIGGRGEARVIFENRTLRFSRGVIADMIDAYGTRAYQIAVGPLPAEELTPDPHNLLLNPSFEDIANAGTPESCYADIGPGRGVTYFVDSRTARHGRHSVRLVVPQEGQHITLALFPAPVTPGKTYRLSVWAKAAPPRSPDAPVPALQLEMEGAANKTFPLTQEWQQYTVEGVVSGTEKRLQANVGLVSVGTAWIDLVQLVEVAAP